MLSQIHDCKFAKQKIMKTLDKTRKTKKINGAKKKHRKNSLLSYYYQSFIPNKKKKAPRERVAQYVGSYFFISK